MVGTVCCFPSLYPKSALKIDRADWKSLSQHLYGFACLDAQAHGQVFKLPLEVGDAELQHLLALV